MENTVEEISFWSKNLVGGTIWKGVFFWWMRRGVIA